MPEQSLQPELRFLTGRHTLSREQKYGAGLLVIALGVRAACLWGRLADPAWAVARFDEQAYLDLATTVCDSGLVAGREAWHLSPLWLLVVALVRAIFGDPLLPIFVLNALCGVGATLVAYRIAAGLVGGGAAFVAALLGTLCGPALFYELTPMPDALVGLTIAMATQAHLELERSPSVRRAAVALGAVGIASLARASALIWVPWILWVVARAPGSRRERAQRAVAGLVALLAVLSPVAIRNALAAGDLQVVGDSGGIDLFIGNGPGATGTWRAPPGFDGESTEDLFRYAREVAARDSGATSSWSVQGYWVHRTMEGVLDNPQAWLAVLANKVRFSLSDGEIGDNRDYASERRFNAVLALPVFPSVAPLLALGWVGLVLSWNTTARRALLASGVLLPACTLLGFFVLGRYRIGFGAPWIIASALTLSSIAAAARERRWRDAAVPLVSSVAIVVASMTVQVPRPSAARLELLRSVDLQRSRSQD